MNPSRFSFPTGRNYGTDQILKIEVPVELGTVFTAVSFEDAARGIKGETDILLFGGESQYQIGLLVLAEYDAGRYMYSMTGEIGV